MDAVIQPVILFVCLVVGGLGLVLALPRRGVSPQVLGAIIAAVAFGVIFVTLGVRAAGVAQLPNLFFYVFALIALGSALRVISHPKPVYSALYFILTILSSSAIYLLLGAEFMAFALIIIYAGAILITYLFVIMLATQAPTEEQLDRLSEYDAEAREPVVAVGAGVLLLVLLSFMLARGVGELTPNTDARITDNLLAELPRKVIRELDQAGALRGLEEPAVADLAGPDSVLDLDNRLLTLRVEDPEVFAAVLDRPDVAALFVGEASGTEAAAAIELMRSSIAEGALVQLRLPDTLRTTNVEGVGWTLIAAHPMALELAGVILLMAMLGAVVLARKQIELTEAEKAAAERAHTLVIDEPEVIHVGGGQ